MNVRLKLGIYTLLSGVAAISLFGSIRNALDVSRGQDLQWTGAQLALRGIDPYRQYLRGDPEHLIIKVQIPNYLHELYILLLPLGSLSLHAAQVAWLVVNCCLTALVLFLLRRIFSLDNERTFLLTLLLFAATPFRIVIAAGQQTMLELLFFCLAFYPLSPARRGVALGLSYFKYSFSPVLVLYLAIRREYRLLLISLLPPLVGVLALWAFVHGNLLKLAVEPFQVSRTGVWPGLGDLMTVLQSAFTGVLSPPALGRLLYLGALTLSFVIAFLLAKRSQMTPPALLAVTGVAGLALFLHLTYDYVFLVLPLALCLSKEAARAKAAIVAIVAWIWYGMKILDRFTHSGKRIVEITTFLLLLAVIFLIASAAEPRPTHRPV